VRHVRPFEQAPAKQMLTNSLTNIRNFASHFVNFMRCNMPRAYHSQLIQKHTLSTSSGKMEITGSTHLFYTHGSSSGATIQLTVSQYLPPV
jgi:hypothetical protein